MSHKRKHIAQMMAGGGLPDQIVEDVRAGKSAVVRIDEMRGTHVAVESAAGEAYLAAFPAKLRGVVWVRKGNYVVVELGDVPADSRYKLRGVVKCALTKDHIAELRTLSLWPFAEQTAAQPVSDDSAEEDGSDSEDSDDPFANGNPNRRPVYTSSDDDDDEDDSDDEDD